MVHGGPGGDHSGPKPDKLPWYIHMLEQAIFCFAGLWSWHKEFSPNYTIITAPPSENISELHHRMLVILKPENYSTWLSAQTDAGDALSLLDDHRDGELAFHRVSKELVNKQKNVPEAIDKISA